ncbi:MAG: 3-deoxy-8-phosphooctulonate synthase [Synergistales bacterium]|nr:3-deoxy-8-phosphooctulonate synthase [Bacteroidales bacterium]MDY6393959.1 3-deoxy-8-phosphooctulonate synthase [Bacteroidales bacterium]MDY6395926.1 3-deoxy-8-phosphooctulonate synthase [Bacteroidales bacterium]MDY6423601.1 3-deoxy-8-phosphooctulonate synthase [Bacteroidales bacterium]MDY6435159.1 3-deoxy-8-phosphooctulonate synthase [Synergistales bacterium]
MIKAEEIYNYLSKSSTFFLLAGPCVIEDETSPLQIAEELKDITDRLGIPFVFKASYRKANRSRLDSFTGIGDKKALNVLSEIKKRFNLPIVTDIHEVQEAEMAAEVADVLQIPAFLCRQTDLLVAAAKTQKIVNIKKGQFLSAESMRFTLDKVLQSGNEKVMLTDRGTFFGYQDLIVDVRNIPIMKSFNVPVVMDITHSLQKPNQTAGVSGGDPQMIETIARASIAVGADGIFMETHPKPLEAKSDGKNMLELSKVENLLSKLIKLKHTINEIDKA